MTALDREALQYMRAFAPCFCERCQNWTCLNYCMECDEYFTAGHSAGCPELSEHHRHRSY